MHTLVLADKYMHGKVDITYIHTDVDVYISMSEHLFVRARACGVCVWGCAYSYLIYTHVQRERERERERERGRRSEPLMGNMSAHGSIASCINYRRIDRQADNWT